MVFCEVRVPIAGDEERISAVLDGIEGFERAAEGAAHWTWCAPGSSTQPVLDEKTRQLWTGAEAKAIGKGGIARVPESTGLSCDTERASLRQIEGGLEPVQRGRE